MIKVAINGFGRIGRLAFRQMITGNVFDVVAINDLSNAEELSYLLRYDTNHRRFHKDEISFDDENIIIAGKKKIKIYSEMDAINLPWNELGVDIVLECTGHYTEVDKAMDHIKAGAKHVIISAPAKGDCKTIVYGVNENILDGSEQVISAASCTTNCLAPVLKVLEDNFKINKGFMSTIHAYTNDQATLDISNKKGILSRRGRACAANIIPTTTGAAKAIGKVIPSLEGKLDGIAIRVPVPDGSMIDCTLELDKNVTKEEINETFIKNANDVLKVSNDPLVSSDCIGEKCGAIVDLLSTNVIEVNGKNLVKVIAWYDNEMGYTVQMMRTCEYLCNKIK